MNKNYRQFLISSVTFFSGLYFFLEYVLPEKIGSFQFGLYHSHISRGFIVIGTMAIGLGVINIVRVHGTAVIRARKGWLNSVALLLGLLIMFIVEGGDFLSSEARVSEWKSLSDLKAYSEQIRKDYVAKKIPAQARVELMVQRIESLIDSRSDSTSNLRIVSEGEKGKKLSEEYGESLETLRKKALALSEIYYQNANKLEIKEEDVEQSSAMLGDVLSEYAVLASAHAGLERQISQTAEVADSLSRFNYEKSVFSKGKSLLSNSFLFPLGAAMFSLLAFYIATAAYRSFRIRSAEAFIMMLAAVIVTLGQIPHGPLYISEDLPFLRLWLLKNLSTPAFRAIYIGAALAGLAMAVRMWLSLEKSPLATEEAE